MIRQNINRNRVIYGLWERGLTVKQIAAETGVPEGTVGYYVRKFNKAAAQGKPVVFPIGETARERSKSSFLQELTEIMKIMTKLKAQEKVSDLIVQGRYQDAYYFLLVLKLMKDLGLGDINKK